MRASSNYLNEIRVVETILGQLQDCLVIFHEQKQYGDFRRTLKDIQIVRKELKKLYAEKDTLSNTVQGETGIDANKEQHRKNVLG
jgi:hypothetical protein